jgi:hypothetical protein
VHARHELWHCNWRLDWVGSLRLFNCVLHRAILNFHQVHRLAVACHPTTVAQHGSCTNACCTETTHPRSMNCCAAPSDTPPADTPTASIVLLLPTAYFLQTQDGAGQGSRGLLASCRRIKASRAHLSDFQSQDRETMQPSASGDSAALCQAEAGECPHRLSCTTGHPPPFAPCSHRSGRPSLPHSCHRSWRLLSQSQHCRRRALL